MSARPHLVFLNPTYDFASPRNIRTRNLVQYLEKEYRISILCLDANVRDTNVVEEDGVTIVRLPYCRLSRFVTNRQFGGFQPTGFVRILCRALSFIINRYGLFPDPWIAEKQRMLRALAEITPVPDVLVASIMPFSMAIVAIEFKRSLSADSQLKLLFDIGDPLSHNVVPIKRRSQSALQKLEQRVLNESSHIVLTNESTALHYQDTFGVHKDRVSIIPQGADLAVSADCKYRLSKKAQYLLAYAGTFIEGVRDPHPLMKVLSASNAVFKLKVCGTIDAQFINGNSHVDFCGWLPHSALTDFYRQADCLLFIDNRKSLQTSGKIYELLAMRKPILFIFSDADSAVKALCNKFNHVLFVPNEESAIQVALESAGAWLEKVLNDEGVAEYDVKEFSWEGRAAQYSSAIRMLLAESC